jgi:hypothetical protein
MIVLEPSDILCYEIVQTEQDIQHVEFVTCVLC